MDFLDRPNLEKTPIKPRPRRRNQVQNEGNSQALPGEIRPQNYTKLTPNLPNLQKYAKVCKFLYINLPKLIKINEIYKPPLIPT